MNSILTTPENRELVATFTVVGEPVSKSRARFTKRGSKMVAYTPQKTLDGERAMAAAFLAVTNKLSTDAEATYAVHAHFINGTRQRRDVDNMVKLILDGLNEVAWPDDNQVTEIAAKKSWGTKADARTEVAIYRIGAMNRPSQACVYCGESFRTYESWQVKDNGKKYCSPKCCYAHRVAKKERTCKECGVTFHSSGEQSPALFCSMKCNSDHKRVTIECTHCKGAFTKPRSLVRASNYCTTECAIENAKLRRSTRFPGTCETCGGGTTRKEYKTCQSCRSAQEAVAGRPGRRRK